MTKQIAFAAIAVLLRLPVLSAEVYPLHAVTRIFGTNQGNVGDCDTESSVTAIETAFAERDLPIRLSLFYHHSYNWRSAAPAKLTELKLKIDDRDLQLMNQLGPWIPEYVWPEDGQGFLTSATGPRPHIADVLALDPTVSFTNWDNQLYQRNFKAYRSGYQNSGDLQDLKTQIDQKMPVTLSIHGAMFFSMNRNLLNWNPRTGLLENRYTLDLLNRAIQQAQPGGAVASAINHSVAVVGYDDALYADKGYATPGALIVRNSWNDSEEIVATLEEGQDPATQADLAQMKFKISSVNLPGYYALPYQYINDLFTMGAEGSGYFVSQINYSAIYNIYNQNQKNYSVYQVPFICNDPADGYFSAQKRMREYLLGLQQADRILKDPKSSPQEKAGAAKAFFQAAVSQTSNKMSESGLTFKLAKIAVIKNNDDIDRLRDFYSNTFSDYYCNGAGSQILPSPDLEPRRRFVFLLRELSQAPESLSVWVRILKYLSVDPVRNGF